MQERGSFADVVVLLGVMSLLLASGCRHSGFGAIDLTQLPTEVDYPEAGAVVLLDASEVRFVAGGDGSPVAEETHHFRARIFEESARDLAVVRVYYDRTFVEVLELEARVITPDGEERIISRDEGVDVMAAPGFVLYTDNRVLLLANESIPLGSVVEYRYRLRWRDPELFQWSQVFGSSYPVVKASLSVAHPPDWQVQHMAHRFGERLALAPKRSVTPDETVLSWERRDLPASRQEPLAPRWNEGAPAPRLSVRLSAWTKGEELVETFADEEALSRWKFELMRDSTQVTPEVRAQAAAVLSDAPGEPGTRAALLYAWVRDNITYCAIEIGLGGWRPYPSSDTHRLGYGDCKDKANLLRALLAADGIESELASIYSHRGFPKAFGMPVLAGNFNHAILQVELAGERVLVDPTTRTVPFGRLPYNDQGADYLVASAAGASVATSPVSPPTDNLDEAWLDLTLQSDRSATGTCRFRATGPTADGLRESFLYRGASKDAEVVNEHLGLRRAELAELSTLEGRAPPPLPLPVSGEGPCTVEKVRGYAGGHGLLRASSFGSEWTPRLPATEERRAPLVLNAPRRRHHRYRVTLPEGYSISRLPEDTALDHPAVHYALRFRAEGDLLVIERTFEVRQPVVEAAEYAAVRELFEEARKAEARHALLRIGDEGT